jgi:hypothetical protein
VWVSGGNHVTGTIYGNDNIVWICRFPDDLEGYIFISDSVLRNKYIKASFLLVVRKEQIHKRLQARVKTLQREVCACSLILGFEHAFILTHFSLSPCLKGE